MTEIFEIKKRIESLDKINDITYAMQIITITRLKKIIVQSNKLKDAISEIKNMIYLLSLESGFDDSSELTQKANAKHPPLLLLFFSNRGFCGNFNQNVLEKAQKFCTENQLDFNSLPKIFVGKKGHLMIKPDFSRETIELVIPERDILSESEISQLFQKILPKIQKRQAISIISANFKSIVSHKMDATPYFPISMTQFQQKQSNQVTCERPRFVDPSKPEAFFELLKAYFYLQLTHISVDSACAEFSQRFMIMKNANDNINSLKDNFILELNKERQGRITQELSEIISTFKALKSAK